MVAVTVFLGDRIVAQGEREAVQRALEERYSDADRTAARVFDDASGRPIDLDYWDAGERAAAAAPRPRGRPRLGVTAREVTLLPRHWEWLSRQPGGASAALRRLVEEARSRAADARERRDAAYRFMSDMAGDRPHYEEALRALYRGERERMEALIAGWPEDIRAFIGRILGPEGPG